MEFLSPLRYPGGKAKVSDFVQCLIKENTMFNKENEEKDKITK